MHADYLLLQGKDHLKVICNTVDLFEIVFWLQQCMIRRTIMHDACILKQHCQTDTFLNLHPDCKRKSVEIKFRPSYNFLNMPHERTRSVRLKYEQVSLVTILMQK